MTLEYLANHVFSHGHDAGFIHKGCLDIDLGEFRLSVSTQIFVAETFGDLVVAIHARHHQNLFEQLRRLRQCEKFARMCAAGYQIVARALRGGACQNRGFDIQETIVVQIVADRVTDLGAEAQSVNHFRAT